MLPFDLSYPCPKELHPACNYLMVLQFDPDANNRFLWKCQYCIGETQSTTHSLWSKSIFSHSKLTLKSLLIITHAYAEGNRDRAEVADWRSGTGASSGAW